MGLSCSTRAPPVDDPLPHLQNNLEIANVKVKQFRRLVSEQRARAQTLGRISGKRQEALQALRKKKQLEVQLRSWLGIQGKHSAHIMAIQEANSAQEIYQNMKKASEGLQQLTTIKIGEIHNMTDDLEGLMINADDFQRAVGEEVHSPEPIDDDELEAELAALLEEGEALLPGDLASVPIRLPADPVADAHQVEERHQLRRLQKEMDFS